VSSHVVISGDLKSAGKSGRNEYDSNSVCPYKKDVIPCDEPGMHEPHRE